MNTPGTARLGTVIGSSSSDTRASGSVTFGGEPSASQTITVGGRPYEYVSTGPFIADDLEHPASIPPLFGVQAYAAQFATAINAGTFAGTANADVYATRVGAAVTLWARASGPGGNDITLATTSGNITVSGATLTGG